MWQVIEFIKFIAASIRSIATLYAIDLVISPLSWLFGAGKRREKSRKP